MEERAESRVRRRRAAAAERERRSPEGCVHGRIYWARRSHGEVSAFRYQEPETILLQHWPTSFALVDSCGDLWAMRLTGREVAPHIEGSGKLLVLLGLQDYPASGDQANIVM